MIQPILATVQLNFSFSPEGEAAVVGGAGEQEGEGVLEREPEGEKEGRGD